MVDVPALPEGPAADHGSRDTSASAEAQVWARDLLARLDRLDPLQSRAMQMVYFQHCTHEQVAAQLSMSMAAVAANLADGMRSLALAMA